MNVELPSPSDEVGLAAEPHRQRLLRGIGANLLGKAWVVMGQVISVPVLLSVWGPKGYGLWVMVSAIPTYATLSDFGFGSAAAVRMTQLVARGQKDEALRVFQSVGVLVSAILTVMLLVSLGFFAVLPSLARLFGMSQPESRSRLGFPSADDLFGDSRPNVRGLHRLREHETQRSRDHAA